MSKVVRRALQVCALIAALVAVNASAAGAAEDGAAEENGKYIVVFKDSVEEPATVARAQTDEKQGDLGFIYRYALKGYSAELSDQAAKELAADPRVAYVEEDARGGIAAQITPTGISRTFAATNKALYINETDDVRANVDVAVLDTGIDYTHPDLNVVKRTDCSNGATKAGECKDESGIDENGHGTHVAGTIGAIDNGFGVTGVAPGARLWAVKVLDSTGNGEVSEYIAGIDWVTAHASEIEVANASLRYFTTTSSTAFNEALKASIAAGVVHVVAAGNENEPVKYVPGNNSELITVSAIADYDGKSGAKGSPTCENYGADDNKASFSNYGPIVDIAAPGVCIYSTWAGGGYAYDSGTSMASPYVAGAAALLAASKNPNSKADVDAIRNTLVAAGNSGWTDTSGDGVKEPLLDLSNESTFKLPAPPPAPPTVTTGTATGVTETSATLNGTVNPNSLTTSYAFEYGTTVSYGASVGGSAGSGTSTVPEAQPITGLSPGTTYHFRMVATNSLGLTIGKDQTFKTPGWLLQEPGNPGGTKESGFYAVSCPLSNSCTGAGWYKTPAAVEGELLEHWNGSTWTDRSFASAQSELYGVSCTSASACTAVGRVGTFAAAYRWNGTEWKSQSLVVPAGSVETRLQSISCVTSTSCTAVGFYRTSATNLFSLVETWNGTSWTQQTSPSPAGYKVELIGVSCSSATSCIAVGASRDASNKVFTLALVWNGSEWKEMTTPNPAPTGQNFLFDVSCTSATACTTVGSYTGGSTSLVLRWNGSEWKQQTIKAVAGAESTGVSGGISCPTTSVCTAVGSYSDAGGDHPVAEVWNGTEWTIQKIPTPTGGPAEGKLSSPLTAVSCSAASACTAVGWYYWSVKGVMQTRYTYAVRYTP